MTLLVKDLKIELRTRYTTGIGLGFGITSFLLVSIISAHAGLSHMGHSVMFWLTVAFVSSVNIPIAFTREEDRKTASTLRLTALPSAVFVSKWLQNALFTSLISLLLIAIATAMWGWNNASWEAITALALSAVLVSLGLAASETLLAAMVSSTKMRMPLMSVIAFPIILPVLLPAVKCTSDCLMHGAISGVDILWFIIYLVLALLFSLPLFEHIWMS